MFLSQIATFNELDKLPSLTHLSITVNDKIGFEETFNNAIGHISQLTVLNKKAINPAERRGAEYDVWKHYSLEWVNSNNNSDKRTMLLKRCRAYPRLIESKSNRKYFKKINLIDLFIFHNRIRFTR